MIYTLTTNPAIDMNIYSEGIKESVVNGPTERSTPPTAKA